MQLSWAQAGTSSVRVLWEGGSQVSSHAINHLISGRVVPAVTLSWQCLPHTQRSDASSETDREPRSPPPVLHCTQVEALLGPKTEADLLPREKPKKAPKVGLGQSILYRDRKQEPGQPRHSEVGWFASRGCGRVSQTCFQCDMGLEAKTACSMHALRGLKLIGSVLGCAEPMS